MQAVLGIFTLFLRARMKILDRYSSAVRSSNLCSNPDTTYSDSDVLGAAGLAAKCNELGIALMRLFSGDNHASSDIVRILSTKAIGKAYRLGAEIARVEAEDLARSVLAWHRDGTCKPCGGHGQKLIPGTTTIGDDKCPACKGGGRLLFDMHFSSGRLELAKWLVSELEREMSSAGPEAMKMLAPRLDLL